MESNYFSWLTPVDPGAFSSSGVASKPAVSGLTPVAPVAPVDSYGRMHSKKANPLRTVFTNRHINTHNRKKLARVYRVEVDGKAFTFLDNNQLDDVRAHMVQKFGPGRVGAIEELVKA